MTIKEIASAIGELDSWFKSQEIEDKYAAIIMSELVALHMARNFSEEGAKAMAASFHKLFDKSMNQYLEGKDEAQRLN